MGLDGEQAIVMVESVDGERASGYTKSLHSYKESNTYNFTKSHQKGRFNKGKKKNHISQVSVCGARSWAGDSNGGERGRGEGTAWSEQGGEGAGQRADLPERLHRAMRKH